MKAELQANVMHLIEEFITRSKPEINDCLDFILPAMIQALKNRYGADVMTDVLHEYGHLRLALLELEDTLPKDTSEDDAYELHVARQEH